MNGILGKIVEVTSEGGGETTIKVTPACRLPERAAVPAWLIDQTLTVRRRVRDPREVGGIGDSIVLGASESEPYLAPLVVEPPVCYGSFPDTIMFTLHACENHDKDPEYEVAGGANSVKGKFTKDGDLWRASLATASLFEYQPFAPAAVMVKTGKHEATCTLLPANGPAHARMSLPHGPVYHLENDWYSLDISLTAGAGAIEKLVEKGRGIDHFAPPVDMVHLNHEASGHLDRVRIGNVWDWFEKLRDTPVTSIGARREGDATRIALDSSLDDGQNLRTSLVHTLFDHIPLLVMQRDYQKGKPADSDKKDETPKEPIDEVTPIGVGFRASWAIERDGKSGSRILCTEAGRLATVRAGVVGEFLMVQDWKIAGGWCLMEHPGRREHMLYLFDTRDRPYLATWAGPRTITLEPAWPLLPLTPSRSAGIVLGIAAGELCGASANGAWIACRSVQNGVTRVGLVARLESPPHGAAEIQAPYKEALSSAEAEVSLGGATRTVALSQVLIGGIGTVHTAVVEFECADDGALLTAVVGGIRGRSPA